MIDHRTRMQRRRAQQLARQPGFTPVSNKRVDEAIQAQIVLVQLEAAVRKTVLSGADAYDKAVSRVAGTLPRAGRSKLYRPRPSKNDSAAYRKASVSA